MGNANRIVCKSSHELWTYSKSHGRWGLGIMYNDVHKSTSPEPMFQIDVTKSAPQIGEHKNAVTFSSLEEAEVRSRAPRNPTRADM